ncbi:uncharacterized protein LOC134287778 [Aedes albopictus]|uniref:Uncharacterized protein n=1 Tax=Aedes albopictus TaxID=7160 RepID=A0ABM1YAN5_AEDAL
MSNSTPSEVLQLQLEFLQQEQFIKLKAIADLETVELSFARKRYNLLRSQLRVGFDAVDVDEIEFNCLDSDEIVSTIENENTPDAFEYASSINDSVSVTSNAAPTSEQICARQVMSADLPTFTGDPQDWPVFYSQYKHTTAASGYSNSENLVRLQRCVKGQALEYVRSRLLVPELVPKVMETLEMLYGRPSILVNSLINKAREISPPTMDHLETIIDYGMAIQNLYDHLIAMDQQVHLRNPTLLAELESKLPGEMKLEWARYKREHSPSSLQTLYEFMNERVEAACELTHTGIERHTSRFPVDDSCSEDGTRPYWTSSDHNRSCLICRRQNHHVEDCEEFKSYDVSRRWRLLGELKLCRCCLGRHTTRVCRNANECGKDRCKLIHHPLLHQDRN